MSKNGIETAVYYFPNYHADKRNEEAHGKGWTEWELMKLARPRFPGHQQPKTPLWGYEDEADPEVMAKKISAAKTHGIDVFVFDWYWYGGTPYLERCLTEGFLPAKNCNDLKFALMWANHDWRNFHPGGRNTNYPIQYPWDSTPETIGEVWDYVIENFMLKPNYWRVGGKPYFSIYQFQKFIMQMGGPAEAKKVLEDFRSRAVRAGLPGVHINGIWYDILEVSPEYQVCHQREWVDKIGVDSYTSYNNLCMFRGAKEYPFIDTERAISDYAVSCSKARALPAPYFPVVTVGWDSSPRTIQSEVYEPIGYPYLSVMDVSAEQLDRAIKSLLPHLESYPEGQRVLFFNAWNEWTEGSYLEPDTARGFALLDVIKKYFG